MRLTTSLAYSYMDTVTYCAQYLHRKETAPFSSDMLLDKGIINMREYRPLLLILSPSTRALCFTSYGRLLLLLQGYR